MNRPGIHQIGRITDDGVTVTVSGWGLSLCPAACRCHSNEAGKLAIAAGTDGSLGLVQYWQCGCCTPWTVDELRAVLRDVSDVRALEATG